MDYLFCKVVTISPTSSIFKLFLIWVCGVKKQRHSNDCGKSCTTSPGVVPSTLSYINDIVTVMVLCLQWAVRLMDSWVFFFFFSGHQVPPSSASEVPGSSRRVHHPVCSGWWRQCLPAGHQGRRRRSYFGLTVEITVWRFGGDRQWVEGGQPTEPRAQATPHRK